MVHGGYELITNVAELAAMRRMQPFPAAELLRRAERLYPVSPQVDSAPHGAPSQTWLEKVNKLLDKVPTDLLILLRIKVRPAICRKSPNNS